MTQPLDNSGTRKLALGAVIALLFLMLIPSVAFAAVGDTYTVRVDTGYLALRNQPAYKDANEIGRLYTGDPVVLEKKRKGKYWWVYAPELDKRGYVNKNYLIPPISYGDYVVSVDKNYLALRTAPSFDAGNEIGQLYSGDVVTVKKKPEGQYWWVYSPKYDAYGYVNKDFLKTSSSSYGNYTIKVDRSYVALRSAPSYDANNEIGQLNNGDVVTVEEKRGQYWWVYSPKYNREGYVNSDFLVQ